MSLFVTGFLLAVGVMFGRLICGYVCPMGFLQDLLYRIKTPKKKTPLKKLRYLKYVVLALLVVILPFAVRDSLSGLGAPWFCKYLCPSGTIFAAIPLVVANHNLRSMAGLLFIWKAAVALALCITAVSINRFFCRTLCPLGAFYGLFNSMSLCKIKWNKEKCASCGACAKACHLAIEPMREPNSPECVRCGGCIKSCKAKALKLYTK